MTIKEQYINLFDAIRTIFDNNGFRPGFNEFPKDISDYFGIRFEYEKLEKSYQPNFIFDIENFQTHIRTKIIIGAGNLLFSLRLLDYRQKFIAENFSGIVTTKKSFFKGTSAIFAIIIFSGKADKKYFSTVENSEDLYNVIFDKSKTKQKILYSKEIDEKNLTPENYNEKSTAIKQIFSKYETKKLGEIAEIINGAKTYRSDLSDNGIPYLKSVCLQNGKIIPDGACVKESDCEKFAKQLLQEGDILVTKYFGQNKIVFVTENDLPAVASDQLAIIRPHSVSDFNLYKYLSSDSGKVIFGQQLTAASTGTTIPSLNISSLRELEIPMLDVNSAKVFETEFERNHRKTFDDILQNAEKVINQISENELEKTIRNDLKKAGWKVEDIVSNYRIYMKNRCFIADLMLMNDSKPLACVEIKTSSLNRDILAHLIKENMKQDNILLIVTLGSYYEVYLSFEDEVKVFKFYEPPKKEELLKIQKEGK